MADNKARDNSSTIGNVAAELASADLTLMPSLGLVRLVARWLSKPTDDASHATVASLNDEAARQELQARIAEAQARVVQEISIARRIDTAEEVEIEEFYDTSGEGRIGVSVDEKGVFGGANGSGRRVTRRVFRFKGYRDGGLEHSASLLAKEE